MEKSNTKIENEFGKFFFTEQYMKLKNYLFNYRFRKMMIKSALSKYFKSNKINPVILDIGSGISPITPLPKETLFIELEKKAVEFLNKQGLKAKIGDITKLPINSNSTDVILCSEVLEHVPNYKKGLKECARVLKKSGILIITVPIHMKYWNTDDEFVGHIRRFNPSEIIKDIKNSGLKIKEVKPIGSRLERFFTHLTVKIARKSTNNFSSNVFKDFAFYLCNTLLLYLIYLSYIFNSIENSSIILIVAEK